MYSDNEKKRSIWRWLAPLLAAVCLIAGVHFSHVGRDLTDEGAAAIREAVERVYPPDLEYLQENYGLQVNTKDFYVTYDAFASNLPPEVIVQPKGGSR